MIDPARAMTAAVFGVPALVALWRAYSIRRRGGQSASWPHVPGVITVSDIQEIRYQDNDGRSRVRYRPLITFQYEVNGRKFTGDQVRSDGWRPGGGSDTVEWKNRYPEGAKVEVYYDPSEPESGVLEPGEADVTIHLVGGGVGLAVAALVLVGFF